MATKQLMSKWDLLELGGQDLDSAFNDGYQLKSVHRSDVIVQWLVLSWAVSAVAVGSFVMGRGILHLLTSSISNIVG